MRRQDVMNSCYFTTIFSQDRTCTASSVSRHMCYADHKFFKVRNSWWHPNNLNSFSHFCPLSCPAVHGENSGFSVFKRKLGCKRKVKYRCCSILATAALPDKEATKPSFNPASGVFCGLASGVVTTAVLNPYDRALFLSIRDRRPFLSRENFRSPYQGFLQSICIRAISSGLWFPLEHFFQGFFAGQITFLAGSAAGICSSAILNPLTAIKYQTWGREESGAMWQEAQRMWRRGGIRPFMFGFHARMMRDIVFGACYTCLRTQSANRKTHDKKTTFAVNAASAMVATVLSGPLNYAANAQYATSSRQDQPRVWTSLRRLCRDGQRKTSFISKLRFYQERMRVGWGTVRVALGMAVGNFIYDGCSSGWRKES